MNVQAHESWSRPPYLRTECGNNWTVHGLVGRRPGALGAIGESATLAAILLVLIGYSVVKQRTPVTDSIAAFERA